MHSTAQQTKCLKIPRCLRCGRQHRSWLGIAKCRWPRNEWIVGDGQYVSLSLCPRGLTAMLHETQDDAQTSICIIDRTACGGQCIRMHYLIDLARSRGEA